MRIKLLTYILLIVSAVVCFSGTDETALVETGSYLPDWLRFGANVSRWILLIFISLSAISSWNLIFRNRTYAENAFLAFYATLLITSTFNHEAIRYAGMTIFVFLVPTWISNLIAECGIKKFIFWQFLAAAALITLGEYTYLSAGMTLKRYTGFYDNANANSFALANMFLISSCLQAVMLSDRLLKKIPLLIFLALSITTQLLSGSRGGFAALLAYSIAFLILNRMSAKIFIIGSALSLAVYFAFSYAASDYVERIWTLGTAISDTGREYVWLDAWELIQNQPFTGYGTDARGTVFYSGNVHNVYIALILMLGFPLGIALSGVYIAGSTIGTGSTKNIKDKNLKIVNSAAVAYLISLSIQSFGEDAPLGIGAPWFVFILAALGSLRFVQKHQNNLHKNKP